MDNLDPIKAVLSQALRLARTAEKSAKADVARSRIQLREARVRQASSGEHHAKIRVRLGIISDIPFTRRWRRRLVDALSHAEAQDVAHARDISVNEARCERTQCVIDRARVVQAKLVQANLIIGDLGLPPIDILALTQRVLSESRFSQRTMPQGPDEDARWAFGAIDIAERALGVIEEFVAVKKVAAAKGNGRARTAVKGRATGMLKRIYLPIPNTMSSAARDAGAVHDKAAPQGVSPWFVTKDMDLSPFIDMLPLAAREQPAGLRFSPVPHKAAGQNLWGVFDAATWDHVRRRSYAATGRRCVICGGRGEGFLPRQTYGKGERRTPVECHEEWSWEVPRQANGIGIQTLRRLLVVCRACHAMFHSGFFMRRAQENGNGGIFTDAIEKRRMLVNRMSRVDLATSIELQSEHLALTTGVDKWVVDLSHLAIQPYMSDTVPILMEGNAAFLPPEHVAGIDFETNSGRRFPARTVRQVYESIASAVASNQKIHLAAERH